MCVVFSRRPHTVFILSSAKSFVLFMSSLHSPAINKILVETVLEKYFNNAVIETQNAKKTEGIAKHHTLGEKKKENSLK